MCDTTTTGGRFRDDEVMGSGLSDLTSPFLPGQEYIDFGLIKLFCLFFPVNFIAITV